MHGIPNGILASYMSISRLGLAEGMSIGSLALSKPSTRASNLVAKVVPNMPERSASVDSRAHVSYSLP
jgi:hypothetical protein